MLSIARGYDPGYLTRQVAPGREGYYLSATAGGGEPPGRWTGRGCAELGLEGLVDSVVMTELYTHFIDPRDGVTRLGKPPRRYKSMEQIVQEMLAAEPGASAERVAAIEIEAARKARSAVMFFDLTFSPRSRFRCCTRGFRPPPWLLVSGRPGRGRTPRCASRSRMGGRARWQRGRAGVSTGRRRL
ncbi:relaxase domain-containing protein [Thermostaphylospora chromogena]|uniref:relaxase domain-containing protein n=1 Tax=Thermostaphylospora chromogena TaxID=35622 RepID=UPI000B84B57B